MAKKLVAYFSASGTTKKTAEMIAEAGNFVRDRTKGSIYESGSQLDGQKITKQCRDG